LRGVFAIQRTLDAGKDFAVADHSPTGPLELGADMDYSEHEKTYNRFIGLAKYTSIFCIALLVAMAFGFFTSAGFISATILFVLICALSGFLLR
jgi:hypothetical protein